MLQLEVVTVEKPPDKLVGWSCQPPFVEGANDTTYPGGGNGHRTPAGVIHSSDFAVLGRSNPFLTRPSNRPSTTSEVLHSDILTGERKDKW